MWRDIDARERTDFHRKAVEFTGNHKLYGSFMMLVIETYQISCEHNLTDIGMNRRAWIGHAACFMAIGCPEYVTRAAWSEITELQRELANNEADKAIKKWTRSHERKNNTVDFEMGIQRLF